MPDEPNPSPASETTPVQPSTPTQETPSSTTPPNSTPTEQNDGKGLLTGGEAPASTPADKSDTSSAGEETPSAATEAVTVESFTLPENTELDQTSMDPFVEMLNDEKLSRADLGQRLLNLQADTLKKAQETASEQWDAEQTTAAEELKNDPVLGQSNFDSNLTKMNGIADKYFSPELRQELYEHGMANSKHLFSAFIQIAKDLGEGGPTPPSNPADTTKTSLEDKLYPTMVN